MDENLEDIIQVQKNTANEAAWKRMQKTTFTRWANEHLKQVGEHIVNLERDFSDGRLLITLLEILSKKELGTKEMLRHKKLDTVTKALRFLEQNEKMKLVSIDSSAIVDGNTKLILGLMWKLVLHYSIWLPNSEEQTSNDFNVRAWLLNWINDRTVTLPIRNFNADWRDGRAVGALVDAVAPGLCPDWEDWDPKEAKQNIEEAMDTAQEWLDIPQLITPEDMVSSDVDELSMITYLAQFQHAKLKPGAPLRARVKAFGPGLECNGNVVDEPATFTVETFNSGTLDILVMDPEGKCIERSSVFRKDGNQTYTCTYVPQTSGEFRIIIKFNEIEVRKSPFSVAVKRETSKEKLLKQELEESESKLLRERKLSQQHENTVKMIQTQLSDEQESSKTRIQELECLKEHVIELQEVNKSLNEQLSEDRETLIQYEDQNRSLMDQSFELVDRSNSYKMENNSLRDQLSDVKIKINEFEEETEILKEKLKEEQDKTRQYEAGMKVMDNKLTVTKQKFENCVLESESLKNQLAQCQKELENHETEIKCLNMKSSEMLKVENNYLSEISSLTDRLSDSNKIVKDKERANTYLKDLLADEERNIERLNIEKESLVNQINELQEKLKCDDVKIASLMEKLNEERGLSEILKQEMIKSENQFSEQEHTLKQLEEQKQSLQSELDTEQKRVLHYTDEIDSKTYKVSEAIEKIKLKEEKIRYLEYEMTEVKERSNGYEVEINILKKQLCEEQKRIQQFEEDATTHKQQFLAEQELSKQRQSEKEILETQLIANRARSKQFEEKVQSLKEELSEIKEQSKMSLHEIEYLKNQLSSKCRTSEEDKQKLQDLTEELSKAKETSKCYEQEVESLTEHSVYLEKQSEDIERMCKQLKDQSDTEQNKSARYKTDMEKLAKQLLIEQELAKQFQYLFEEQERLKFYEEDVRVSKCKYNLDMPYYVNSKKMKRLFSQEGKELVGDIALGSLSASLAYLTLIEPGSLKLFLATGAMISTTGYRFAMRRKMIPAGLIGILSGCFLLSCCYKMCRHLSLLVCPVWLEDTPGLQLSTSFQP